VIFSSVLNANYHKSYWRKKNRWWCHKEEVVCVYVLQCHFHVLWFYLEFPLLSVQRVHQSGRFNAGDCSGLSEMSRAWG